MECKMTKWVAKIRRNRDPRKAGDYILCYLYHSIWIHLSKFVKAPETENSKTLYLVPRQCESENHSKFRNSVQYVDMRWKILSGIKVPRASLLLAHTFHYRPSHQDKARLQMKPTDGEHLFTWIQWTYCNRWNMNGKQSECERLYYVWINDSVNSFLGQSEVSW